MIRLAFVALLLTTAPALGQRSVIDSVHNLAAGGPGEVRAAFEQEVCIFCHTPHRSAAVEPLWNRRSSGVPYTVYSSRSLDADPGQPTGSSKMCLSCHDGSIALGSVLSRDQVIMMAGGISTLAPGSPSNLGTDLSDDHPVSFSFDSGLAGRDPHLVNPFSLPQEIKLDGDGEMQCTSCHDAHDDTFGDFLVMDNIDSALCTSCHAIDATAIIGHANCRDCHKTHSAPSGPFLLNAPDTSTTCLGCHDGGTTGAVNILAELQRFSAHDGFAGVARALRQGGKKAAEQSFAHGTCADCHEPHTMSSGPPASAPNIAASMGRPTGMSLSGATVEQASFEYEVCFRCHGDQPVGDGFRLVSRQIAQTSTARQFDPSNPSFHPVVAAGRNGDVPSLRSGWTEGSLVLCSDCHGSDTSRKAGGSGPNGVHGSNYPGLLLGRYETIDDTPESSAAYALCYRCHERDGYDGILSDRSFPHSTHVVDSRTPCSVCHDPHGISSAQGNRINNSHLINFDTSVVQPDPFGRMEFVDQGRFSGSCNLTCHGVVHSNLGY
ncbi:MAG: cytochrome c3 family protein [Planctomycetota bacterium]|jgi:predicted CXXCH cytochrome family protein